MDIIQAQLRANKVHRFQKDRTEIPAVNDAMALGMDMFHEEIPVVDVLNEEAEDEDTYEVGGEDLTA